MKRSISTIFLMLLMLLSFLQCVSYRKIETSKPIDISEVYYQDWVSGTKGGDSGFNVYISVGPDSHNMILDSVYFKGNQVKLETSKSNKNLYIGRFTNRLHQKEDMILSNEPYAEYGNKAPKLPKMPPMQLEANECMVSYKEGPVTKYYKIKNIIKREPQYYPRMPLDKQ